MVAFICLYSLIFSFVLSCYVIALLNKNKRTTSVNMDCEPRSVRCGAIFGKVEQDGK
mgnify:FL=1